MKQAKVTLAFNGKKYEVTGLYYGGCAQSATQEREPASFEVQHIAGLAGADVLELAIDEEFEAACCKAHEQDIAFAEIEAAEREQERMKEEV